jgi:hypothetical protein
MQIKSMNKINYQTFDDSQSLYQNYLSLWKSKVEILNPDEFLSENKLDGIGISIVNKERKFVKCCCGVYVFRDNSKEWILLVRIYVIEIFCFLIHIKSASIIKYTHSYHGVNHYEGPILGLLTDNTICQYDTNIYYCQKIEALPRVIYINQIEDEIKDIIYINGIRNIILSMIFGFESVIFIPQTLVDSRQALSCSNISNILDTSDKKSSISIDCKSNKPNKSKWNIGSIFAVLAPLVLLTPLLFRRINKIK